MKRREEKEKKNLKSMQFGTYKKVKFTLMCTSNELCMPGEKIINRSSLHIIY